MDIQVIKATKEHYEEIIKLYGDFVDDPQRFSNADNDSYLKFLDAPNSFMDLVVADNKIIAFITYTVRTVVRYPKSILEVEELYVHPDYRKHGIGKKLMEHILEYAKSIDCQYVFFASDMKRTEAHEFYKVLGFNEYGYHYRKKP